MDFSSFLTSDYHTVIIPLETDNDIWSFVGPFDYEIWIFFLLSAAILILAMAFADNHVNGRFRWQISVEFVVSNALSEGFHSFQRVYTTVWSKKLYLKVMALIWIWSCFVLVKSYAGNLTAMITRPKLSMKFSFLEDFLDQNEITLVTEDETALLETWRKAPINSTVRQIIDQTQMQSSEEAWPSMCFQESTLYTMRHASICDINGIRTHLSNDFSEKAKCNWYTLKQSFFHKPLTMVLQVCTGSN